MTATNGCTAGKGHDTIKFTVTGTIKLADTLPEITDSQLTINGPLSPNITIDGGGAVQVMRVGLGTPLNLNRLIVARGFLVPGGGASMFNQGTVSICNCTFSGNSLIHGGGAAIDN
jgi:hypothetical protein